MRTSGLGLVLIALCVAACGDDAGPPTISTEPTDDGGTVSRCIDEDGDGAGRRCGKVDCDDNDPDITDECLRCNEPSEDCPCDEGTPPELCVPEDLHDTKEVNGQLLQCVEGARYCHEPPGLAGTFVWSDCEGVYTLVSQ